MRSRLGVSIARLSALVAGIYVLLLAGAVRVPLAAGENVANPDPGLIARWEPCEPNTGVTEIVDDQQIASAKIYVGCAPGEQANGVEALQDAGFQLEGTANYGLAFICRIDGEPTPAETPCITTPGGDAYWSYWRGKPGGRWAFSGVGAKSPQSRSPVNSVEGWSFGGGDAPRIEPMDGSGPSAFSLPAPQESSVGPAALAREWLAPVLDRTAVLAEELEAEKLSEHPEAAELLPGAIALARAGLSSGEMKQISNWLARSCEEKHVKVEGCPLRELASPKAKYPERFALAVLGLQALGQNPSSFAGRDLRGELEEMIDKSTGEVKSEGARSKDVEVTAPTVLALARTGTLPEPALKTVGLILDQQNAITGSWETTTAATSEAIEALVAAREQGAGVLGPSRLEKVEAALVAAGGYLEGLQEADGGVRESESAEAVYDPSVKSSALGAVGLALSGRRAASERAAKWVSRYQVSAEYAGVGDPETGEHTPAEDLIGAFLPGEAALRNALAYGVGSDNAHGLYVEARAPTIDALLALVTAGPYGPYDAAFDPQALAFETRAVGSRSGALTATLANHDVRTFTIAGVGVSGRDAGDFSLQTDGCAGKTLAAGESCGLSVSFDPTTTGEREALLQVMLAGSGQTIDLPVSGPGAPESEQEEQTDEHETQTKGEGTSPPPEAGSKGSSGAGAGSSTGSQGVLSSRTASAPRVQTPRLDGQGAGRGLVGVSWQVLEPGVGLSSWTISSRTLGAWKAGYVPRDTGTASASSALVQLPAGAAYELQITFADVLGASSTTQIGKVLVPYDDRSSRLRYRGRWQRLTQAGAWLDTVSRGGRGAQVSITLGPGRPVFLLRATAAAAKVEVSADSRRQLFAVARGSSGASRLLTAAARSHRGTASLRVLQGTVELDGVAVEA
jgi:hypothetical protein